MEQGVVDLANFQICYAVLDADSRGVVLFRENALGRSYANFKFLGRRSH